MPKHQCSRCKHFDPPPKRCGACKKAWYCSPQCQRRDWVCHIFDCNPSRPITSADYVALGVERHRFPENTRAEADYGFGNDTSPEHGDKLLELYTDLLHPDTGLGVKPTTLHKWKTEGTLVENMIRELQRIPEKKRGDHVAWFFQNPRVIEGKSVGDCALEWAAPFEKAMRMTWCLMGLSVTLPMTDMQQYLNSLPFSRQECVILYCLLLMKSRPGPANPTWVKFGFAACGGPSAESQLAKDYLRLICICTFEKFCRAYESASLVSLMMDTCGTRIEEPYVLAVLSQTPEVDSVWWLNQYITIVIIEGRESDLSFKPMYPTTPHEYGFVNCQTSEDQKLLVDLYKAFFSNKDSNPLALHRACMQGRLFVYFTEDLKCHLRQRQRYRSLLRNPYPLKR